MTVLPMERPPTSFSWRRALLRPEVMTFVLLVIAAIVGTQLSPFFADLGFVLESATYYIEFGIVARVI